MDTFGEQLLEVLHCEFIETVNHKTERGALLGRRIPHFAALKSDCAFFHTVALMKPPH